MFMAVMMRILVRDLHEFSRKRACRNVEFLCQLLAVTERIDVFDLTLELVDNSCGY